MINYIALATALLLSAIAGVYSVIGLATIFSGAYISVLIMGATLEAGKVVTVSWLTRNWDEAPKFVRYYLCSAVVVLMFITSMGTFGYLSKAHLEQKSNIELSSLQMQPLQSELELEQRKLRNAQTALDQLDGIIARADVKDASYIRQRQRNERQTLGDQISDSSRKIAMVNAKLLPLRTNQASAQAEIGPLKYIAELIYGDKAESYFDSAVRFVIIIIVFVFDPLAIILLIAANISMYKKPKVVYNRNTGKLEVDKSSIFNFKRST